jgi:hypothetical protein
MFAVVSNAIGVSREGSGASGLSRCPSIDGLPGDDKALDLVTAAKISHPLRMHAPSVRSRLLAPREAARLMGLPDRSAVKVNFNPFAQIIEFRHAQWRFGFKVFHFAEPSHRARTGSAKKAFDFGRQPSALTLNDLKKSQGGEDATCLPCSELVNVPFVLHRREISFARHHCSLSGSFHAEYPSPFAQNLS